MRSDTDAVIDHWHEIADHGGDARLERLFAQAGPQHLAIHEAMEELRPTCLLEIGASAGLNLMGAESLGIQRVCGIDIDAGAMAFAARLIAGTFITGDLRTVLPLLAPKSWAVSLSCYTLAYISPDEIERVLRNLVAVTDHAVILAEPVAGVIGTPRLWGHDYPALAKRVGFVPTRIRPIPETDGLQSVSIWEVR